MGRHAWSDEVKQEALALLADPEQSYYDVHKATGVPASTLHDWAAAAGLTGHTRQEQTEAARSARSTRMSLKREVIAEKLLDAVETFADSAVDAKPREAQALMTAAAIALDKFRLEMGEATSRTETHDVGSAEKAKQRLDELAERRSKKTA